MPSELLYADDLVIMAPTMEQLGRWVADWRASLLGKGLSKIMVGNRNGIMIVNSRKCPCSVCGKGVQANSHKCTVVRGESGWRSFVERKVKCIVDWLLSIVYEGSLISDIGRACLMEVGYKSRWWARCNHVCEKFGMWELVNLIWHRNNKKGMAMLAMKYDRNVVKKTFVERTHEYGRRWWRNGLDMNEREQQHVQVKNQPKNINMQTEVWEY